MPNECDHERIRTGTAKELKEALKRHKATTYLPWLAYKRACEGRRPLPLSELEGIHEGAFDNEEER